jgi:hypothetical protein
LRWLYNTRESSQAVLEQTDWITPDFANIKEKRTKRISPYSETELWERDEILSVIKYEPFKRNKAALTLFWDVNARNHEVTLLKVKHVRLLENNGVKDEREKQKLEFLLKSKKWNPYCIRHSSITSDSDFLPEYALKKKVRWSMNSKKRARYIKRRMGNDLKQKILVQNGIISEQQIEKKPSILDCPRCNLVNAIENKYCSKCSYPLVPSAFDEIKEAENRKIQMLQEKYEQDMKAVREEIETRFQTILARIDTTKLVELQ